MHLFDTVRQQPADIMRSRKKKNHDGDTRTNTRAISKQHVAATEPNGEQLEQRNIPWRKLFSFLLALLVALVGAIDLSDDDTAVKPLTTQDEKVLDDEKDLIDEKDLDDDPMASKVLVDSAKQPQGEESSDMYVNSDTLLSSESSATPALPLEWKQVPNPPREIARLHGVEALDDFHFVVLGRPKSNEIEPVLIQLFDWHTQQWTELPSMPTYPILDLFATTTSKLESSRSCTSTSRRSLQVDNSDTGDSSCASYVLYVVGGNNVTEGPDGTFFDTITETMRFLEISITSSSAGGRSVASGGDWTTLPASMNTPRYNFDATTVGEYLYVFGGIGPNDEKTHYTTAAEGYTTAAERYYIGDIGGAAEEEGKGKWEVLPSMPKLREYSTVLAVGNHHREQKIYVSGGLRNERYPQILVFDVATLRWDDALDPGGHYHGGWTCFAFAAMKHATRILASCFVYNARTSGQPFWFLVDPYRDYDNATNPAPTWTPIKLNQYYGGKEVVMNQTELVSVHYYRGKVSIHAINLGFVL